MITLKRDNIIMEVATELQASVFLRAGYVRVDGVDKAAETVKAETVKGESAQETGAETANEEPAQAVETETAEAEPATEAVPEKPKRRRKPAKQA